MKLELKPEKRPYIWSIRANWPVLEHGLYYDPDTGEMFYVSESEYVNYIGMIPKRYLHLGGT